ncbi:MAG: DUF1460 domain-containing protein [Deltaproteobacteria bacterium]|nr:DUF1460 domain-containing protein [Deltaproteobacteria bacterium]
MKNSIYILILALIVSLAACDGSSASSSEDSTPVPEPSKTLPGSSADELEQVPFELVTDGDYEVGRTRSWKVDRNIISINADLTGDGKLDLLEIGVLLAPEAEEPILEGGDGIAYILKWPYSEIREILVGDIDADGDADIILDEERGVFLLNIDEARFMLPVDSDQFERVLQESNKFISSGNLKDAFKIVSSFALGTPHSWTVPGEGVNGRFDRDDEYDMTVGNCVTWVEKIIAILGSGGTYDGFRDRLRSIRYLDGIQEYPMRNHFQSVDWIPNNIEAGFISEIDMSLSPIDLIKASGTINKKNWYKSKTSLEGDFSDLDEAAYALRLLEFKNLGMLMPEEKVSLSYYPFENMIVGQNGYYTLDPDFVDSLPEISIFNLVNKELKISMPEDGGVAGDLIMMNKTRIPASVNEGNWMTDLLVTHVGFLVKEEGGRVIVYNSTPMTDTALSIMAEEDLVSFLVHHKYIDNSNTTAVGFHLSVPILQ